MNPIIRDLGAKLVATPVTVPLNVHVGENELLVELTLGSRKQNVQITTSLAKGIGSNVVRLTSRACPVSDHKIIRSALVTNFGIDIGGLVLNSATSPPVLDVVYCLIIDGLQINELLFAIESVARLADAIEKRILGTDVF